MLQKMWFKKVIASKRSKIFSSFKNSTTIIKLYKKQEKWMRWKPTWKVWNQISDKTRDTEQLHPGKQRMNMSNPVSKINKTLHNNITRAPTTMKPTNRQYPHKNRLMDYRDLEIRQLQYGWHQPIMLLDLLDQPIIMDPQEVTLLFTHQVRTPPNDPAWSALHWRVIWMNQWQTNMEVIGKK